MRILKEKKEGVVDLPDPSEYRPDITFMPGKDADKFRDFVDNVPDRVVKLYEEMRASQTVAYVKEKHAEWTKFNHAEMSIMEAVYLLDNLIDDSDPDIDIPNSVHAFQTAERIRQAHPDKDWFHLTGLIHDLGKVMALWGVPQWAVVGDTFPVGCSFSKECVFHEQFKANPDNSNPKYNTQLGMYSQECGLENVLMSWGHDEYLYRVLVANGNRLPEEALFMIRFHSFYPWHTGGDYSYLCTEKDLKMKEWVKEFNQFDLYSKADEPPDPEQLKDYYQPLIKKYLPDIIRW